MEGYPDKLFGHDTFPIAVRSVLGFKMGCLECLLYQFFGSLFRTWTANWFIDFRGCFVTFSKNYWSQNILFLIFWPSFLFRELIRSIMDGISLDGKPFLSVLISMS